jgi:hypothetical protein
MSGAIAPPVEPVGRVIRKRCGCGVVIELVIPKGTQLTGAAIFPLIKVACAGHEEHAVSPERSIMAWLS